MITRSHERTLDSFSDEVITKARPATSGKPRWYASIDLGPDHQVSWPDFTEVGATREEAIARCAKQIRADHQGIGKYAPHQPLERGSYDFRWKACVYWAAKEHVLKQLRDGGTDVKG